MCMFEKGSLTQVMATQRKDLASLPLLCVSPPWFFYFRSVFTLQTVLHPFFCPFLYLSLPVPLVIEGWKRSITVTSHWTLLPASLLQSTGTDLSPWKQPANKTADFLFCQSVPLYPLTCTHTRTCARTHAHTRTCTHKRTHINMKARMQKHSCKRTYPHIHSYAHTSTHALTHTHTNTHTCTCIVPDINRKVPGYLYVKLLRQIDIIESRKTGRSNDQIHTLKESILLVLCS